MVYIESIFSRDGRYEIVVKRRIAASNSINCPLVALMGRRNVAVNTSIRGVSLADRIRNYKIQKLAGAGEDITVIIFLGLGTLRE